MDATEVLKQDIQRCGCTLEPAEWHRLSKELVNCAFQKGDVIQSQARVADHWLFVASGIVASEQSTPDGNNLIARFFEAGHLCSNPTSAWHRELGSDDLIAITNVEGVLLPNLWFREQYLRGGNFGEYLRIKAMQTLMFDKDILSAKTSNDVETRYGFLESSHSEVVRHTAQKDLARFIGVTPQGLNRFLKNRQRDVG